MESHAVTTSLLQEQQHFSKYKTKWQRLKASFNLRQAPSQAFTITAARQYAAEILGTLLFVYVGTGTVVALAAKGATTGLNTAATNTCVALAFGFAIACMVYATANVSGGHLNPAITIAFMCTGNIDVLRGFFYIISQIIGAIAASALVRATTPYDDWSFVSGGATKLGENITVAKGLFLEVIITYMLIFTVFGTVQLRNSSTGMGKLAGLAIGLAVLVSHTLGQSFTGPGMNPARSLGPAIVFQSWDNHWVYWVGPIFGGVLAAITYQFVLQPEDKEKADIKFKRKQAIKQQRQMMKQQKLANKRTSKKRFQADVENGMSRPEDRLSSGIDTSDGPQDLAESGVAEVENPLVQSQGLGESEIPVPMDSDSRDSIDRDGFTMAPSDQMEAHDMAEPNIHPDLSNVLSDPSTTRI